MASQANPLRVHFHDSVQINIIQPSQHNPEPRWDDPPSAACWDIPPSDPHQNVAPATLERNETIVFHQVFLKAKPRSRGLLQVFVAHFQLALGIVLNFVGGRNFTWLSYITFWGPPVLIISGFLAVVAQAIPVGKLVKSSIVLHSISFTISFLGLILCCIDSFRIYPCGISCTFGNMGTLAIVLILLMTNMIQLSMCSYIVIFGCRSLKQNSEDLEQTHGERNPEVFFLDPPAYTEVSANCPQPAAFTQPPAFLHPPAYPEMADMSPPPPYTE